LLTLSVGVLLPSCADVQGLWRHLELVKHLHYELMLQLRHLRPGMQAVVVVGQLDGKPVSADTLGRLQELVCNVDGCAVMCCQQLPGSIQGMLRHSQLLLLLAPENGVLLHHQLSDQQLRLASMATVLLEYQSEADGCTIHRCRGDLPFGTPEAFNPASQLLLAQADLSAWVHRRRLAGGLRRFCSDADPYGPWIEAWALEKSDQLEHLSNRRLQAKLLVLVLPLLALSAMVASPLALVGFAAIGFAWLNWQPLRKRSLEWWCVAHILWVQRLWHSFGIDEEAAEFIHAKQRPLHSSSDEGSLLLLLRARQLWLWSGSTAVLKPRQCLHQAAEDVAWWQTHAIADARQLQGQRRWLQWVMGGLLLLQLMLPLLGQWVAMATVQLAIKLLLPMGLLTIAAVWYRRPVPMVSVLRQQRFATKLNHYVRELRRAQTADQMEDPDLAAHLRTVVRDIGVEVIDLVNDSLEISPWQLP
jgi:hypothetical protein